MSEHLVQAARDALELEGELVTYTDIPGISDDIWVKIQVDVDLIDGEGTPMGRVTTLRGVKADMPKLSEKAEFTTADGDTYQKLRTIKNDNITIAMVIGKKVSV